MSSTACRQSCADGEPTSSCLSPRRRRYSHGTAWHTRRPLSTSPRAAPPDGDDAALVDGAAGRRRGRLRHADRPLLRHHAAGGPHVRARRRKRREDVVSETFLGVIQGIDRFEGRSSLKTWLFRILVNRAKTRGQREARYAAVLLAGRRARGRRARGRPRPLPTPTGRWADAAERPTDCPRTRCSPPRPASS